MSSEFSSLAKIQITLHSQFWNEKFAIIFRAPFSFITIMFYYFRFKHFKTSINNAFTQAKAQHLKLEKIVEQARGELPEGENPFTSGEISAAIKKLTDENLIMLADDTVFLI